MITRAQDALIIVGNSYCLFHGDGEDGWNNYLSHLRTLGVIFGTDWWPRTEHEFLSPCWSSSFVTDVAPKKKPPRKRLPSFRPEYITDVSLTFYFQECVNAITNFASRSRCFWHWFNWLVQLDRKKYTVANRPTDCMQWDIKGWSHASTLRTLFTGRDSGNWTYACVINLFLQMIGLDDNIPESWHYLFEYMVKEPIAEDHHCNHHYCEGLGDYFEGLMG